MCNFLRLRNLPLVFFPVFRPWLSLAVHGLPPSVRVKGAESVLRLEAPDLLLLHPDLIACPQRQVSYTFGIPALYSHFYIYFYSKAIACSLYNSDVYSLKPFISVCVQNSFSPISSPYLCNHNSVIDMC